MKGVIILHFFFHFVSENDLRCLSTNLYLVYANFAMLICITKLNYMEYRIAIFQMDCNEV